MDTLQTLVNTHHTAGNITLINATVVSERWQKMAQTVVDNPSPFADVVYRDLGGI